jgi:hypothetical protein
MKAQNQDSLIQLYKGMGDTLDFVEVRIEIDYA